MTVTATTDFHKPPSLHAPDPPRRRLGHAVDLDHPDRDHLVAFQRAVYTRRGPHALDELIGPRDDLAVDHGKRYELEHGSDLERQHDGDNAHVHVAPNERWT
jgi:hypothetical protein